MPAETVPCETCGTPTAQTATRRCNRCWTVEGHLPEYVKTVAGRAFVLRLIAAAPQLVEIPAGVVEVPAQPERCSYCKLALTICLCSEDDQTGHDSSETR